MAITDALTRLADRQELQGKAYSDHCYRMIGAYDRGLGGAYIGVEIHAHGANTLGDISFKVMGYTADDMSDAFIINQTEIIPQADVHTGDMWQLPIIPVNKAYDKICVLFDVAGGTEQTQKDDIIYCPPVPIIGKPEEAENTYSAWIVHGFESTAPQIRATDGLYLFNKKP